jgi:hypothetical protein
MPAGDGEQGVPLLGEAIGKRQIDKWHVASVPRSAAVVAPGA